MIQYIYPNFFAVFVIKLTILDLLQCFFQKGSTEGLGEVKFFPDNFFNLRYYPYYGKLRHVSDPISYLRIPPNLIAFHSIFHHFYKQVNYSSPLVAVQFSGVQYDTQLHVQCKLNGKGIINDSPTDRFLGSVSFTLEVGA